MPTWSQGFKQFLTANNGKPLVGGKLYTYAAGTTNIQKLAYKDAGFTTQHTNPIILDSRGEALVYWSGNYKIVATYPSGRKIWTVDNVNGTGLVLSTPDTVELPPIAYFTYVLPVPFRAPGVLPMIDGSSRLTGADSYVWKVNGVLSAVTQNPQFLIASPGDHVIQLTVSNEFGESSFQSAVTARPFETIADFSFSPLSPAVGQSVAFSNLGSTGTYLWDFGDGNASTVRNPSHTYTSEGTFSVTLTTTDNVGTDSITRQITVAAFSSSTYVEANYVESAYVE